MHKNIGLVRGAIRLLELFHVYTIIGCTITKFKEKFRNILPNGQTLLYLLMTVSCFSHAFPVQQRPFLLMILLISSCHFLIFHWFFVQNEYIFIQIRVFDIVWSFQLIMSVFCFQYCNTVVPYYLEVPLALYYTL